MACERLMKTICPLDCPDCCGIVAKVADGRVVSLQGDKDHPYTNGFICRKMKRYPERLYWPERILHPQLRTGKKGEGQFRRIAWDEALDILVSRVREIRDRWGGEAILPYSYAGNMGMLSRFGGMPLFNKLGASELLGTICSSAAGAGWEKQCGPIPGCPPENAADAELIVTWGINVRVSNLHFWQYIAKARGRGAKLLVIDPYRGETALRADYFCQLRPGGDTALALGIMKLLHEQQAVDHGFIDSQTTGYPQFAASLARLGWARLEEDSGVARDEMQRFAALFANTGKTFVRIGIGMSRNSRGGMGIRAVTALAAMLGLFGGGEGRGVLLTTKGFRGDTARLTWPDLAPQGLARRQINMIELGYALNRLEPSVKAMIIFNTNPVGVNPDGSMVRQGFAREDLFTVVHEQVMTPTARYADLLLPAATFLETGDLYAGYGHFYLGVSRPVIAPMGEAVSNFDLFQKIAHRMGFSEEPFLQSGASRLAGYLETVKGLPDGIGVAEILAGMLVKSAYSRDDGRVFSAMPAKYAFVAGDSGPEPAMVCLTSPGEAGDAGLRSRFPLQLITPPHPDLLNSTFGERYRGRTGEILIHPEDAVCYGVEDGRMILLRNHRGACRRVARVTAATRRGVVVAEGIFWADALDGGGINDLTSQKLTDMGGGATFHESLVAIDPVDL